MRKWLLEKSRNKSFGNVLVLMSGTFLSQVLPILFFPILSRIYSPADYGVLGIFMSISMLLVVISNFQFNHAILIPKEDGDALKILSSGSSLVIFFSLLSLLFSFLLNDEISVLLNSPDLKNWMHFLPITLLFSGINVQFSSWFNRLGQFKIITTSRIVTSIVTISFSLGLSFLISGPGGLVIAYSAGTVCGAIVLLIKFRKQQHTFYRLSWAEHKNIIKTYRNFLLYTTPTELMSSFSQQLPLYIFSYYSGVQSVGWFSRSRQMLGIPINYLSNSISEVYKQKASEAYRNNPAALTGLFFRTLKYLVSVSVFPFLFIGIFSADLFAFFFGEPWRQSGVYTQCLVLMYFLKFSISPLTFNFDLFGKQRLDFVLHLMIIALTILGLYVGFTIFKTDTSALILFSIAYSSIYLIYGFLSYRFTKIKSIL